MSGQMHIVSHFELVPQCREEMLKALETLVAETRKEPGCISYILTQNLDNPLAYTFIECWASTPDFEAHLQTPHFKVFKEFSQGKRQSPQLHKLRQAL